MALHDFPTGGTQTLRALGRYPSRTAFTWDGGSLTYGAATDLIGRMQQVLVASGLGRGGCVASLSANRADAWCAGAAATLSAAMVTALHPLASLDDQLDQLADAEADTLIVDAGTFLARGGELAARATGLKHVFTLGRADYGSDLVAAAAESGTGAPVDLALPEDLASLGYTGGTTGKAKGVLRRQRESAGFAPAILADFELPAEPRFLAVAPLSHVAGTKVLPVLMRGGTVHMQRGFDPAAVLAAIARERINLTLLVPTMIYVLLDHPKLDATALSSLELLLYGASPMSPSRLIEGLERIGPVFSQLYGQTECYPISVLSKADHDPTRPELFESCGFPVASCAVRIVDGDDREVPTGAPGEICVRAPYAMAEYWRRPEQTAETLRNGWVHTGDIARMDERGYLFILDRKKDMIVTGGFNVYPREVEDVLSAHADVAMVAVIGIPDPKWGEAVTAMIVRRPGAQASAEDLIDLVKRRKGAAHAPKHVEFVDALPTTSIGKVDKKALRAKFWAGRKRMVG
jgi:fatty-acyl-CoA synthase